MVVPIQLKQIDYPAISAGFTIDYYGTVGYSNGFIDDPNTGRWVYLTNDSKRTIGSAASGASINAGWTKELFKFIWSNNNNTLTPIYEFDGSSSTRGSTADNDWDAAKRLSLPDVRGRVNLAAGTSGDTTNVPTTRNFLDIGGRESHTEIPVHRHDAEIGGFVLFVGAGGTAGTAAGDNLVVRSPTAYTGDSSVDHMNPFNTVHRLISAGYYAPSGATSIAYDSNSVVIGEVPTGLVNGINNTYVTANDFVPGTLEVYLNGIRLKIVDDYQTYGTLTLTLNTSPLTGEKILVDYLRSN